jgi:hypothetical protein
MTTPLASGALVPGALRASKGAWLFRPDALDVLWRVSPLPVPTTAAPSTSVRARLVVLAARVRRSSSPTPAVTPRTGVPTHLCGPVVAGGGGTLVVDVGVPVVVDGVQGSFVVGDVVEVEVDDEAPLRCIALDG